MMQWFNKLHIATRLAITLFIADLALLILTFLALAALLPNHPWNQPLLPTLFFVAVLVPLFVWYVATRLTRPLHTLIKHIEQLNGKKTDERYLPVTTKDETGKLVTLFNELLQELDDDLAAQQEATQIYRIITENTSEVAVWRVPDGSIRFISPNCETIFGYLDSEFYADPDLLKKLIHPEDQPKWHKAVTGCETLQKGLELRICASQGNVRWFLYNCHPVVDDNFKFMGIRSSYLDITPQKVSMEMTSLALNRANQAKKEWEETMDCINDVVILVSKEHRIQRTNKSIATLTGRSISELIGKDWRNLLQQSGFKFSFFSEISGEIIHEESGRLFDIFFYPIQHSEEHGMVITMHDSTELRSATTELQKAYDNLEKTQMKVFQQEKLASIGQLAAGVAHEINNPMGFISSNLSSLKKYGIRLDEYIATLQGSLYSCPTHPDMSDIDALRQKLKVDYIISDITQLIEESLEGAERVRKIVADLKSFSRVDEVKFTQANINDCLDSTINIVWNELKYVAEMEKQYGELPMVLCYPQQLNQVFMNLLVNAAHAITDRGTIIVKTWASDESVFVSITDSGKGISPEHIERIFEPFFTTKEVGKGTGLGLSICYDIIKKHAGDISVESSVGKGSTFTVRLPVAIQTTSGEQR